MQALGEEGQALALFWLGHIQLWYQGENETGLETLRRAATSGGRSAQWARLYMEGVPLPGAADAGAASSTEADAQATHADDASDWVIAFLNVFRYLRVIDGGPNFNLLTERYDFDVYLTAEERKESIAFHRALRILEEIEEPVDPVAHYALLYYLRSAQRLSWPLQPGGGKALEHRNRFLAVNAPDTLEPLRRYYLVRAAVGPLAGTEISVMSSSERKGYLDQLEAIGKGTLPEAFVTRVQDFKNKLSNPERIGGGQ